jgi:hypothetical protein
VFGDATMRDDDQERDASIGFDVGLIAPLMVVVVVALTREPGIRAAWASQRRISRSLGCRIAHCIYCFCHQYE